jgi:GTP cyclohydrolase I
VGTLARVVEACARRLVLQEAIGEDVVAALAKDLAPRWVVCRLVLRHGCMIARGERAHGAQVETVAVAAEDDAARAQAFAYMQSARVTVASAGAGLLP